MRFENCKYLRVSKLPFTQRQLVVKVLIYIQMIFTFSTPDRIRNLWQLKTIIFLHWYLMRTVLLGHGLNQKYLIGQG